MSVDNGGYAVTLKYAKVRDVKSPQRGTPGSAGIDFFVPNDIDRIVIEHGKNYLVPSGIKVDIPKGFALFVCNKGGVASKKSLVYGAHVVDEDFQGEIFFDIHNIGTYYQIIEPGDKLIQCVLIPIEYCPLVECTSVEELYKYKNSDRGEGMLGSTGTV